MYVCLCVLVGLMRRNRGSMKVSVCVQFYDGGVFDSFRCSSTDVNHAMTLIGYGSYNGKEYWMVKNR